MRSGTSSSGGRSARTPCKLVRMKAEAIVYAARGVGLDTVAEMVERAEGTVRKWLSQWRQTRPSSVVTGHAVGVSAARLKRAQKEELEEVFSKPPSESGVKAGFWGVPALEDVASDQVRRPVQVGLLLPAAHAFSGYEPQAARPVRGAPRRGGHRQADGRDPGPGLSICSRTAGRPVPSTRSVWSTRPRRGGCGFPEEKEQGCTWTGRRRAGRSSGH